MGANQSNITFDIIPMSPFTVAGEDISLNIVISKSVNTANIPVTSFKYTLHGEEYCSMQHVVKTSSIFSKEGDY